MGSFDIKEESRFTQKGSPTRGKSASGHSAINSQESEIREKKKKEGK